MTLKDEGNSVPKAKETSEIAKPAAVVKNNDDEDESSHGVSPESGSLEMHFDIWSMLFMNGHMVHSRKHWNQDIFVVMPTLFLYAWLAHSKPSKTQFHRQAVFLFFLSYVVYQCVRLSPYNANHLNVCGYFGLVLFPLQFRRCQWYWKRASGTADTVTLNKEKEMLDDYAFNIQNIVRLLIVVLYFMTGFHKLNWDFLNPDVSCALEMIWPYFQLMGYDEKDEIPSGIAEMLPYGVLALELAAPLLLCFEKLQRYAIPIFIQFHLILLPMGFADFGSIAMSILWLFVGKAVATPALRRYVCDSVFVFVFFEVISIAAWYQTGAPVVVWEDEEVAMVLFAYSIFWMNVYRAPVWKGPTMSVPKSIPGNFVVLFFIWFSFNPYLGLRTVGTLTMFSNLRTEIKSNHIILGDNQLKMYDYQEDTIEILDFDSTWDEYQAGHIIPKVAFALSMRNIDKEYAEADDFYIKLRYKDTIYESDDVTHDPAFDIFREVSYWQVKWMDMRYIQPLGTPQECAW